MRRNSPKIHGQSGIFYTWIPKLNQAGKQAPDTIYVFDLTLHGIDYQANFSK